jgi:hypothetical protein
MYRKAIGTYRKAIGTPPKAIGTYQKAISTYQKAMGTHRKAVIVLKWGFIRRFFGEFSGILGLFGIIGGISPKRRLPFELIMEKLSHDVPFVSNVPSLKKC